jgi:aldehyde:ferredoxin oxidoreductase
MKYYACMGKVLWVDLSCEDPDKQFYEQAIDPDVYKEYLTGYGIAAKILFENRVYDADPLGPDNVLGFMSGLLTNTGAFFSGRWEVVGKSPLTGGWGDANCGGYFAPAIKKTGYDGIFFKGRSKTPVYLLVDGDTIELRDAGDLWQQKDTAETENILKERHGANFKVASIGKGAENLCRFGAIVTDYGRAAARSGLGAVMGSKNLKALCLGGNKETAVYDVVSVSTATGAYMNAICNAGESWKDKLLSWVGVTPFFFGLIRFLNSHNLLAKIEPADINLYGMRRWGTCGTTAMSSDIGDSPVKNWMGVGYLDFPGKKSTQISDNAVTAHETAKYGCHHCPLRCGGKINYPKSMENYPLPQDDRDLIEVHKVEYETSCGFGTLILNANLAAIVELNEMCNKNSLDTISCAAVVAWAIEAFENNVITTADTDGITLEWGDIASVKLLVQKIIDAEGIGKILKEGVKRAAEHFGGSDYAMNAGGQELPMHDPRQVGGIGLGVQYETEPTPGRHTSTCDACNLSGNSACRKENKKMHKLKGVLQQHKTAVPHHSTQDPVPDGEALLEASCKADVINGLGLCLDAFGLFPGEVPLLTWINSATGWNFDGDYYLQVGRRIKTVRHCFNIMAGITLQDTKMNDRARGYKMVNGQKIPVLTKGPNARRMPAIDQGNRNYYQAMGYDLRTGIPQPGVLEDLNLEYVRKAIDAGGCAYSATDTHPSETSPQCWGLSN